MAIMLPDHIDMEDPRRNGERLVFDWLSKDNISGTAYYSLHQNNHKYKLMSEIDFLYVCDRGFICIEVKGGQEIYRKNRSWHSVNRRGVDNEIKNPFEQAMGCQYALKSYFSEVYGAHSRQADCLVGYAVIFPECKFTGDGNDLVNEVVFDCKYNIVDFPKYINKVFDYWENQEKKKHGAFPVKLNHSELNQINNLLRGDFQVVPSLHLELQNTNERMINLTDEQYELLDIAYDNKSVIILGGAGTGKSLLAIEMTRRYAAMGKDTLYLCYNKNMASYASASIADKTAITVSTFHALLMNCLDDKELYKTPLTELCRVYLSKIVKTINLFDAVVIDEGQDLFKVEIVDVLNSLLINGMEKSNWVFFMDPNQNIFNNDEDYELTMEYIRELYNPVLYHIKTNCRNTKQIARRTAAVSIIPPARYMRLAGPKVGIRKYRDNKEFLRKFKQELNSILSCGISPIDIVVLSKRKMANSLLKGVNELCNLKVVEATDISSLHNNCLNYFTIQSFKGLESKVVFLIDIDGFKTLNDRHLNYVGMSRAKLQLFVFFNEKLTGEYEEVLETGRELL